MSLQYDRLVNEAPQSAIQPDQTELYAMRTSVQRGLRWPRAIGLVQIILGMLIAFLGLLEVFVLPLMENHTAEVQFNKSTCYGTGIIAGFVMVLCGSMAVRASLSRRKSTAYKFFNLTLLTLLVYAGLTVFLIVAYSQGWTSAGAYPPDSHMHQVHMFVTILVVLGLMFALTAVVQYYEVVCCGEMNLWQWWSRCLCAICSTQTRTRQPSESDSSISSTPPALLI